MAGLANRVGSNLWVIPIACFTIAEALLIAVAFWFDDPILLVSVKPELRKDIYSSVTGSSSGLLGFCLAAVAILAAFAPKRDDRPAARRHEREMAEARSDIAKCLLVTSLFLVIILGFSTVGIGADVREQGNVAIAGTVTAAGLAAIGGILISGLGVTLSILERSQNDAGR
ncbi:hypothetical protein [Streptomyces niveus]|uniref:hypothetical protein n=1 Tax=Streptomyces niveus TaxID=193462 RepID=UPI00344634EE